jgi:hypothetical protein
MKYFVSMNLFLLFLLSSCRDEKPTLEFCDDATDHLECRSPVKSHSYHPQIPPEKQKSWFDLGYHMYFHTRETPGILVRFNSRLSSDEVEKLRKNLECELVLTRNGKTWTSHMEGRRVADDGSGFWCFDYLGSALVRYQKLHGDVKALPQKTFFPMDLEIRFHSHRPEWQGSMKSKLQVEW